MYEVDEVHPYKAYNDWTKKPGLEKYHHYYINGYIDLRTHDLLLMPVWCVEDHAKGVFYGRSG